MFKTNHIFIVTQIVVCYGTKKKYTGNKMASWSIQVNDEGYVVVRGNVPIPEFQNIINKYCNDNWKVDMQWAKDLDATFVICKPELAKEWKKNANA